jgi:hypothetical protein
VSGAFFFAERAACSPRVRWVVRSELGAVRRQRETLGRDGSDALRLRQAAQRRCHPRRWRDTRSLLCRPKKRAPDPTAPRLRFGCLDRLRLGQALKVAANRTSRRSSGNGVRQEASAVHVRFTVAEAAPSCAADADAPDGVRARSTRPRLRGEQGRGSRLDNGTGA